MSEACMLYNRSTLGHCNQVGSTVTMFIKGKNTVAARCYEMIKNAPLGLFRPVASESYNVVIVLLLQKFDAA